MKQWYGVRTLFLHSDFKEPTYEERIAIYRAESLDEAIAKGEVGAAEYVSEFTHYLGYIDAFEMYDEPGEGAEVYSLMRCSQLTSKEYIDRFFDTGDERAQKTP